MRSSMAPVSMQFNMTNLLMGQRVNAYPLTQPYRHPIEIEEVHFAFSWTDHVNDGPTADLRALLHQLKFGIKFGEAYATLDKTATLQAFGRRAGRYDGWTNQNNAGPLVQGNSGLPGSARGWLTWKFPEPVFVPEKAQVECLFEYGSDIPNPNDAHRPTPVQAWVSLTGRALPKMEPWPSIVRIPWVTSFKTPAVPISEGAVNASTPESGLQNQNEEPVVVQRMLGSVVTQKASDEIVDVNVRVSDTSGAYIVREQTPLFELFNGRTRAWDMGAVLKSKEFVVVEYSYDPASIIGNATPAITYQASDEIQLIFGLVGYREMSMAAVYPKVLVPATGQPPVQRPNLPAPTRQNGLMPKSPLGAFRHSRGH